MKLLYEAHSLQQTYQGVTALLLSSFCLYQGETVALTGPNGSGKSTLLRLLAFLEEPRAGSLIWHGESPRRNVTLLLQEPYLLRDSVLQNVTLGLRLRGQRTGLEEPYCEAMRAVGFEKAKEMANRPSYALSGGEKQRVALAARLVLSPQVLLLDEPTASVDARSAQAIIKAVRATIEAGTTVVYATHDRSLLEAWGGRELQL